MTRLLVRLLAASALMLSLAPAAFAQDNDDAVLIPAEPDYTLVGLPTSLRLPEFKSAFRVTHRFQAPLKDSGLGDLFGLDAGATIGLEYRFGIYKNTQIGFYRTSDKTIEFFSEYGVARQGRKLPVDLSAYAAIEGTNNFKDSYSPTLGAIISRRIDDVVALYVEPMWVNNTNPLPSEVVDHNDTFVVGIGGRVRFRPTAYVVAEVITRAAGFKGSAGTHNNTNQASFGIEKRVGGHVFRLNVGNGHGSTPAQMARGAFDTKNWYLGFNISRKFF